MPVIVVSDDPGILSETESTFLRRSGFELVAVSGGDEVPLVVRDRRPDLLLLEAGAAPAGGVEICRALRADPALGGIPVILVGSARERVRAIEAGAGGWISRPVTRASLLAQVRRFIALPERETHRIPLGIKVTCRTGEESFVAFTRDLSPTGLFLKSPRPPAAGTRLGVSFVLAGSRQVLIDSEAEVVREAPAAGAHGAAGAGLRFTSLPAATKIEIGRFLRDHAGRP